MPDRIIPDDALRYEEACAKVREVFRTERTPSLADYAEARRRVDAIDTPWSGATYNHWRVQMIEHFARKLRDARLASEQSKQGERRAA